MARQSTILNIWHLCFQAHCVIARALWMTCYVGAAPMLTVFNAQFCHKKIITEMPLHFSKKKGSMSYAA